MKKNHNNICQEKGSKTGCCCKINEWMYEEFFIHSSYRKNVFLITNINKEKCMNVWRCMKIFFSLPYNNFFFRVRIFLHTSSYIHTYLIRNSKYISSCMKKCMKNSSYSLFVRSRELRKCIYISIETDD